MFVLLLKEEMARLQQEIESLKAERAPGRDEKVRAVEHAPDCGGCVTSTREGFLEESPAESGAERDQTCPQPCPLSTHFSRGFRQ